MLRPVLQSSILFCLLTFPVLHFCLHFLSRVFTFPRFKGRMEISTRKQWRNILEKSLAKLRTGQKKSQDLFERKRPFSLLTLFIFPPRDTNANFRFHCFIVTRYVHVTITALIVHPAFFLSFFLSRLDVERWTLSLEIGGNGSSLYTPFTWDPRSITLHRCG